MGLERLRKFLIIDDDRDPVPPTADPAHAIELENVVAVWPVVSSANKAHQGQEKGAAKGKRKRKMELEAKAIADAQQPLAADGSSTAVVGVHTATTSPALTNVSLVVEKGTD